MIQLCNYGPLTPTNFILLLSQGMYLYVLLIYKNMYILDHESFYNTYFFQISWNHSRFLNITIVNLPTLNVLCNFCAHCLSKLKFQYVCFVRCHKEALRMLLLFLDVKNQISTQQSRRLQCCFNIHKTKICFLIEKVDIYKSLTSDFDLTFFH